MIQRRSGGPAPERWQVKSIGMIFMSLDLKIASQYCLRVASY